MQNYCNYEMQIKGSKENVNKMISYLQSDYSYNKGELESCTADKHFFRVFEADVLDRYDNYEYSDDAETTAIISGYCAWSVSSCMFNEGLSYYADWVKEGFPKYFKGTHMEEATKDLELIVEIFSEEPGCGFMEHYIVNKGVVEVNECVDWKQLHDEDGEPILDEYGDIKTEGGIEWDFSI